MLKEATERGLRYVGLLFMAAAAAAAAVTTTPTAPSASALSKLLKDVSYLFITWKQGNNTDWYSICRRRFLHQHKHWFDDVQLLPGGRLLLADSINMCVKLFNTQGQHLHTLGCRSEPWRLAVLDSSSIRHTVAVTLPYSRGIDLLEVNGDNMEVKNQWVVHSILSPHLKGALVALWIESQPLDLQGLFCCGFEPCDPRPSLTESPKA
ncbi:hypothetical protein PoB_000983800 [Plakobranchus ocellatus]|uniref:Uncharacterized protein n=1 Tax=Plakobranchus ocellatus TaxID=259542 RepID=A0AAV3YM69_9GAST|nr:hypothetical protein PoB_000983800 [Plakobranchus ocellatus]